MTQSRELAVVSSCSPPGTSCSCGWLLLWDGLQLFEGLIGAGGVAMGAPVTTPAYLKCTLVVSLVGHEVS